MITTTLIAQQLKAITPTDTQYISIINTKTNQIWDWKTTAWADPQSVGEMYLPLTKGDLPNEPNVWRMRITNAPDLIPDGRVTVYYHATPGGLVLGSEDLRPDGYPPEPEPVGNAVWLPVR